MSNSVKMQRRFVVTNLQPSSVYQLKVETHNVAGSNQAEFTFVTLTKEGGKLSDIAILLPKSIENFESRVNFKIQ